MLEQTDIGHFARIPYHVATAKIPSRARDVWILLAMNCTPESPEVWVRQPMLAEQLNCSTDTIGRVLRELITAKLIFATNKLHQGRYKIYRLAWANLQEDVPQKCQTTFRKNTAPPRADSPVDVPQKCQNLNRIRLKQEQNIILENYGELWQKRFGCLDGLSGRPSLETCVEQALNHSARHKCSDVKIYVEMWLQKAARDWVISFNREQNASVADPSLDAEAKARRSRAESERARRYYAQSATVPVVERNLIPPELQAQVDEIIAASEVGFTDKLLRLMKSSKAQLGEAQMA